MEHHTGHIVVLEDDGLVIVQDDISKAQYAFTFDKLRGYRGQSAREAGLRTGKPVAFQLDGNKIARAELVG